MAAFFEGAAGGRDAGPADRLLFATSSMPQPGQYPGLSKTRPSLPHPHGGQTYSAAATLASTRDLKMPGRPSESTATNVSINTSLLSIKRLPPVSVCRCPGGRRDSSHLHTPVTL